MSDDPMLKTTRIQRAFKMHEVPPERWGKVIAKAIAGSVVALGGLGILYGVVRSYIAEPQSMSVTLLSVGVVMFGVGMNMISGKFFTGALRSVLSIVVNVKRTIINPKDDDGERSDG